MPMIRRSRSRLRPPTNDNHSGQRTRWEIATDVIGGLVVAALIALLIWTSAVPH